MALSMTLLETDRRLIPKNRVLTLSFCLVVSIFFYLQYLYIIFLSTLILSLSYLSYTVQ